MPTCFSKCEECVYLDILPMEHHINGIYFNDFKLNEALIDSTKLPYGITAFIIKLSKDYHKCSYCTRILCTIHRDRGLRYGENGSVKCDSCCWMDL